MVTIITVLLCALTNQVICQSKDVLPAKILAQQKIVSENSDLRVTCSTFGRKEHCGIYVYLWKDGHAIQKVTRKKDQHDIPFIISSVGVEYSGNYSCVCSLKDYTISEIDQRGDNIIEILVIANFLPADISVVGSSTVYDGDHVEFRCSVSDTLHTLGGCPLILSYLRKNETILQLQTFDATRMETTFSIKGAVVRDSGHYSCIVLPTKCIQEHENAIYGRNTVFLEVKVNVVIPVSVTSGVVVLMTSMLLCLCWISYKQGHSVWCNPWALSQQANADTLEEQQEQAGEDYVNGQIGDDSFSSKAEEEPQYDVAAEDSTYNEDEDYSEDGEGVYSVVPDDAPTRPSGSIVYATSRRHKRPQIQLSPEFNVQLNV